MNVTFGEQVRITRERNNVTQQELATMTGLSRCTISKIENDKRNATIDTMSLIANKLGTFLSIQLINLEE
jgi:transcriptional regulator with XRE-family HTH domain